MEIILLKVSAFFSHLPNHECGPGDVICSAPKILIRLIKNGQRLTRCDCNGKLNVIGQIGQAERLIQSCS